MISTKEQSVNSKQKDKKVIKCVVWDLDNTLWQGVLLEDEKVSLGKNIVNIIHTLDSRGILQSIASKNEFTTAIAKLEEFGLKEYFLYPQINWNSKANSLKEISNSLNIGLDAIAFVDDQLFELEEVKFSLPEILCLNADEVGNILDMPVMNPRFITEDSRIRRLMYISDIERK
ncbi:MAG: HAD-IIIC family phosphatase, partial [Cyanobacteria bacterium P01_D01_bin.116]